MPLSRQGGAKIMYTLKVSYGYVDDEPETTGMLGTYETWDEAADAAENKFSSILDDLSGNTDICFGDIAGSQYDYYVTYGDHNFESGRVFSGYDYFCQVAVVEI